MSLAVLYSRALSGMEAALVTVEVQVPTDLDDAAREALSAYRDATAGHDPRAAVGISPWLP